MRGGLEQRLRSDLERLHREAAGPIDAGQTAKLLSISLPRARRLLSYFYTRGWLARIARGLYVTVPLGAANPQEWREDPWIVASRVFEPAYIGGWSAAEHWALTEQVFRSVVVFTSARQHARERTLQDTTFVLKVLPEDKVFGTRTVWRGENRIAVSDPSRTVLDVLDEPRLGGGGAHVAALTRAYFESEHRDDERLLSYVRRLGNRTVFKRLGYLVEALGVDAPRVVAACASEKSAGISPLDPSASPRGRIVRRWNLRVNVDVASGATP